MPQQGRHNSRMLQVEQAVLRGAILPKTETETDTDTESIGAPRRAEMIRTGRLIVMVLSRQVPAEVGYDYRGLRNCMITIAATS